ncbi:MAG: hypothetical protein ACOYT4_02325 [Nanoarchaeota archaeon]
MKLIFLSVLILAFLSGFFLNRFVFTGKAISEENFSDDYSWTKAICNAENECVDVYIECRNGKAEKIELASGLVIHDLNWTDPRGNFSDELCK